MLTSEELIVRCEAIARRAGLTWSPEEGGPFFQIFRPHGVGVEEVLADVPFGDLITKRLESVYQAAGEPLDDLYFVVRSPQPVAADDVKTWANQHLENLRSLAVEGELDDINELLDPLPKITVREGGTPPAEPDEELSDLTCCIADDLGDFMADLDPPDDAVLCLQESLYHIACDDHLRDYILWPVFQPIINTLEPFSPYFELWKHGVEVHFPTNDEALLVVPEGKLVQ